MYDDYFTNGDKPFVENFNDALLVSNVFDYTIDIELPKMFSNKTWVDTGSPRKAGVSIVTLLNLEGFTITTDSGTGDSILATDNSDSGILVFKFYPNFQSYGNLKKISWTSDNNNVWCRIRDKTGTTTIVSEVTNGANMNVSQLKQLDEFWIQFACNDADVLRTITLTMENKQETRYGADVSIGNVSGLSEALAGKEDVSNKASSFSSTPTNTKYPTEKLVADSLALKVDKVDGKGLSTNDFSNTYKTNLDTILDSFYESDITLESEVWGTIKGYSLKGIRILRVTFGSSTSIKIPANSQINFSITGGSVAWNDGISFTTDSNFSFYFNNNRFRLINNGNTEKRLATLRYYLLY